eukprot:5991238-Amphidinium_carterae.1
MQYNDQTHNNTKVQDHIGHVQNEQRDDTQHIDQTHAYRTDDYTQHKQQDDLQNNDLMHYAQHKQQDDLQNNDLRHSGTKVQCNFDLAQHKQRDDLQYSDWLHTKVANEADTEQHPYRELKRHVEKHLTAHSMHKPCNEEEGAHLNRPQWQTGGKACMMGRGIMSLATTGLASIYLMTQSAMRLLATMTAK